MWLCSLRGGTGQVAHIISKLAQRPRQSYKYYQIKQETHYILFQVNEPCDCCKMKSQARKEFDEGITKVNLLRIKSAIEC